MSNPKKIYLQPVCPKCDIELPGGHNPDCEGRQWCSDAVWESECDGCGQEVETPTYILSGETGENDH